VSVSARKVSSYQRQRHAGRGWRNGIRIISVSVDELARGGGSGASSAAAGGDHENVRRLAYQDETRSCHRPVCAFVSVKRTKRSHLASMKMKKINIMKMNSHCSAIR